MSGPNPLANQPGERGILARASPISTKAIASDKQDDPKSVECDILLALAELYATRGLEVCLFAIFHFISFHATLVLIKRTISQEGDESMVADAYDCVYKARELGSVSYLPDIHATV